MKKTCGGPNVCLIVPHEPGFLRHVHQLTNHPTNQPNNTPPPHPHQQIFDRMGAMANNVRVRALPFLVYMGSHSTLNCALSGLRPSDPTVRPL